MATKAPEQSAQLERKQATIDEIQSSLDAAQAAMLTEYRGLTVSQIADLRSSLREADAEYKIFKNTLARRAVEAAGRDDLLPMLEGPVAFAFVHGDPALAAKALAKYESDFDTFALKGGLFAGRVLTADDLRALSKVPPRDELLALIAGALKAPMARAAGAFAGVQRKAAYALAAYIDARIAAGETLESADASDDLPPSEPDAVAAAEPEESPEPVGESSSGGRQPPTRQIARPRSRPTATDPDRSPGPSTRAVWTTNYPSQGDNPCRR